MRVHETIRESTRLVGRPVFFSMAIILLAFIPVFALTGQEGSIRSEVGVKIFGNDLTVLEELGRKVAESVRRVPGASNVYAPQFRNDAAALGRVLVAAPNGAQIPLSQLAHSSTHADRP